MEKAIKKGSSRRPALALKVHCSKSCHGVNYRASEKTQSSYSLLIGNLDKSPTVKGKMQKHANNTKNGFLPWMHDITNDTHAQPSFTHMITLKVVNTYVD